MTTKELYKDTHRLGYNTRDFPTEVDFESCQKLYNAFPNSPNPIPRPGIQAWDDISGWSITPDEIIPWSEDNEELIVISGVSFYSFQKGDADVVLLSTTTCEVGTKFAWTRIQKALYIITDREANAAAYIISKNDDGFVFRNANIDLATHTVATAIGGAGNISQNKYVGFLATLVRRDDSQSVDSDGDPVTCSFDSSTNGFNPGRLESIGDLDLADYFQAVGGDKYATVTVTFTETPDSQATHLRIYRTLEADSEDEASGLAFRWRVDIPLVSGQTVYTYDESTSDDSMAGSLNQWKTVGYNDIPSGTAIAYHKGLLWVGGTVYDESFATHKGRWYYSQLPLDADFPEKWYSMFNTTLNFKDTSLDDEEDGESIGVFRDDVVFIMSKNTVWKLLHGDATLEPDLISSTKGSKFPKTLIKIDEMLVYLSNEGPAYLENDQVFTMRDFTAGEVWPQLWDGSKGFFFQNINHSEVRSFYFKSTWWICYGRMMVGMYMPVNQKGFGPMRVVPSWSQITADSIAVLGDEKCVMLSNHAGGSFLWDFLNPSVHTDNGYYFNIECLSKAFYVNKKNPDLTGELLDLLVHLRYTDTGTFNMCVVTDRYRVFFSVDYTQVSSGVFLAEGVDNPRRNIIQQGFPEGGIGRIFEIGWRKLFKSPYDFEIKGFSFRYIPLPNHIYEYHATTSSTDEYIKDALDIDRSIEGWSDDGKIYDAGDNSRDIGDYTIRNAGDAATRLAALS